MGVYDDLNQVLAKITEFADLLPGLVIVANVQTQQLKYLSPSAEKAFGLTEKESKAMSLKKFQQYIGLLDAGSKNAASCLNLVKDEPVPGHFKQLNIANQGNIWHLCSAKVLAVDTFGVPILVMCIMVPVYADAFFASKLKGLVEDRKFHETHVSKYKSLGRREREVLRLVALGYTSKEIAVTMGISETTAKTHRRNIKSKLDADSSYDINKYANVFGLM